MAKSKKAAAQYESGTLAAFAVAGILLIALGVVSLLAVVGGFSGNEIADIMKRPPGTLRCRLHRTLKKLRKTLDELDENE